ncbi:MAG: mechanosensitive ion channel family protein [Proteobacteria bacterium]|nr:mechanosensitive ion channel family protein [Pseudomonadota bacterium]
MQSIGSIFSLWSMQVIVVLIATIICHYLFITLNNRLVKQFPNYCFIQALSRAASAPGIVLIWLIGLSVTAEILDGEYFLCVADQAIWLRAPLIIATLCWLGLRLNTEYFSMCAELRRYTSDYHPTHNNVWGLVQKAIAITIVLASGLVILPMLGLNIEGLLALGGVGGIVAGFAARDLLSSILRGALLHMDKMFTPGDYVRIAEKNVEGTVEHIGWLKTTIRTPFQTVVYLPNMIFDNLIVENIEQSTGRLFNTKLMLKTARMGALDKLTAEIGAYLASRKEVDKKNIIVGCAALTPYAVELEIRAKTNVRKLVDFYHLQQALLIGITGIIEKSSDVELAKYPADSWQKS